MCSQDDVIASSSSFRSISLKGTSSAKRGGYGAENAYHRLDDYLPCFFVFHNSKKTSSAPFGASDLRRAGYCAPLAATQIDI